MGPGEDEAQRVHDRRMERLSQEQADKEALIRQRDEAYEKLDYDAQVMLDFMMEEFGDERSHTWEAPFTTRKFVEMVRDRIASLRLKVKAQS